MCWVNILSFFILCLNIFLKSKILCKVGGFLLLVIEFLFINRMLLWINDSGYL